MALGRILKNLIWPTKENNFRPYVLHDEAIAIYILLFLVVKVLFSFEIILVRESSLFAEVNAQKILLLTNDIRKQYNIPPVKENNLLDKAAQEKAQDMLRNRYFSHDSPTGVKPWHWIDNVGYDYHYAGENLAMNFFDSDEVVKAWLNSPEHRKNLLNKHYKDIGVAILAGDFNGEGIKRTLVVQVFASPMRATIPVAKAAAPPKTVSSLSSTTSTTLKSIIAKVVTPSRTTITSLRTTTSKTAVSNTTSSTLKPVAPLLSQKTGISPFANIFAGSTRQQIDIANKFLAALLVVLGAIVIGGIILQRRKTTFAFSELLMRSIIVIIVGISFLAFHFPALMEQLTIS